MRVRKFAIVGCQKSGTTSLMEYLSRFHPKENLFRNETWFNRRDGVELFKSNCPDYKPIIILRDPIERAWSEYNYQIKREVYDLSYPEAVGKLGYDETFGELNPVEQSRYSKWIHDWLEFNPLFLTLEYMQEIWDFPKENQNNKIPMPVNYRNLTRRLLKTL